MLHRIVLPTTELIDPDWHVTLITGGEPGALPAQVETLETKQARKLSLPTYCEVPIAQVPPGAFAKIRTTTPTTGEIADYLQEAAARRIPFKATAGLHHPVRSAARGMHGFLNVFVAAGFAWHTPERGLMLDVLNDEDPGAFTFGESELRWRGHPLTTEQVEQTRREFAHSFGSCSFDEPVADLREMGLLP